MPHQSQRARSPVARGHVGEPHLDRGAAGPRQRDDGEQGQPPRREMTTPAAAATTQTTTRHQQHTATSTCGTRRSWVAVLIEGRRASLPALEGQGVAVIIVSEPSADGARRVRTGRCIPRRSRSSVAYNDTPRHADAQRIRVHTRSARKGSPSPQESPGSSYVGSPASRAPLCGVADAMAQAPPLMPAIRRRGGRV